MAESKSVKLDYEQSWVTNALVQATLKTKAAKIFSQYSGFDEITAKFEEQGRYTTLTIEAKGMYLYQGDIACGELRLNVVERVKSSPGLSSTEYTATLDRSGLFPSRHCQINEN